MAKRKSVSVASLAKAITTRGIKAAEDMMKKEKAAIEKQVAAAKKKVKQAQDQLAKVESGGKSLDETMAQAIRKAAALSGYAVGSAKATAKKTAAKKTSKKKATKKKATRKKAKAKATKSKTRSRRSAKKVEADRKKLLDALTGTGQSKSELIAKVGYKNDSHFNPDIQTLVKEKQAIKIGDKRKTVYKKA
jgi:hypothetical protein